MFGQRVEFKICLVIMQRKQCTPPLVISYYNKKTKYILDTCCPQTFFFAHRHFLLVLGTIIFYLKILSEQTQTIEMQAVISLLHFLQNYKSLQNAHYISQPCSFKYLMLLVKCTCGSRCFIWQVRCLHPTSQCLDLLLCLWLLTPASHRCGPLAAVVTPQVSDLLSLL